MSALSPPPGDESVAALVELIAEEIDRQGPMTFERFMRVAIAHPQYGYYASSRERAGYGGDFLTAPETHPIFGSVIARQIVEMWSALGGATELTIREFGAGRGTLARQILAAISASGETGLSQVRYQLVDLAAGGDANGGEELGSFEGVVVANELLDALPFHRLVAQAGELREIYVSVQDGWFRDQIGPLSEEATRALPGDVVLAEGQRIELSPQRQAWLRSLAGELIRGFVILIDYGYPRRELHDAARFPGGTLKTYRAHEVGEDPYLHIGGQDITAHVDFTAIEEAAVDAGFDVLGMTTQAEFVAGLGIERDLMDVQQHAQAPDEYLAARTAVMALLDPAGLGRFRVSILGKGIEQPVDLSGLRFRLPRFGV